MSARAKGAYVIAVNRQDLSSAFSRASQVQNPSKSDVVFLNRAIPMVKKFPSMMRFLRIDFQSARIVIMTDEAFATNPDNTSQLGIIVTVTDNSKNCNILHCSSTKSLRVTRSVLELELFAVAHEFAG